MSRGRKPAVSAYQRHQWLEELEKGEGITKISKAARRDIRSVKRHIEIALEERQIAQARREFLVDRLQQHQADLLAEVQRLRQVVIPYPPRPIEPADTMQRKVHDALKEHTKRIPLRGLLEAYLRAAQEWEEARERARSELAAEEAKMVSSLPQEADLHPRTLGLLGILERGQPIKGPSGRSYAENKGNDGTYKPSWGEFSLTRSPIRQAILTDIVEAHEKLVSTAEPYLLKLQNQHQRLKELTDQIADELDGFLLKRLVPGRCRFCPF